MMTGTGGVLRPNTAGLALTVRSVGHHPDGAHHVGVEAPPLLRGDDVPPAPVDGVVVPGGEQEGLLAPKLLPELSRQTVVHAGDLLAGVELAPLVTPRPAVRPSPQRPAVRAELGAAGIGGIPVQQTLLLQSGLDLKELLLVVRPLHQDGELVPQEPGRLHTVAPVAVHVDRAGGGGVVDEEDAAHHVLVGFVGLGDAGDGVMGDEVFDTLLSLTTQLLLGHVIGRLASAK